MPRRATGQPGSPGRTLRFSALRPCPRPAAAGAPVGRAAAKLYNSGQNAKCARRYFHVVLQWRQSPMAHTYIIYMCRSRVATAVPVSEKGAWRAPFVANGAMGAAARMSWFCQLTCDRLSVRNLWHGFGNIKGDRRRWHAAQAKGRNNNLKINEL